MVRWFNHYLKGRGKRPKMDFRYFRDWVHYKGIATPAYAKAKRYPVGRRHRYFLSGSDSLVRKRAKVDTGDDPNFAASTSRPRATRRPRRSTSRARSPTLRAPSRSSRPGR